MCIQYSTEVLVHNYSKGVQTLNFITDIIGTFCNKDKNDSKYKLDSFDVNLNSLKRKLDLFLNKFEFSKTQTWFFWRKLEYQKTQTWTFQKDKLDFHKTKAT